MNFQSVVEAKYVESVDARLASDDAYVEYQMQEACRAIPFLSKFFQIEGARVLEVGTGRGGKGIAYALAGMNVTALDVDEKSLALAADAARGHHACVNYLSGDGTQLPFTQDSFDAILLDSVIEHVRDPRALVQECARVLKRDGIVFVVFPPYYGPLSGHIDDYVMIPWFHLLPRARVKRYLLSRRAQAGILSPRDAFDVMLTLNGLTIFRFKQIAREIGLRADYFRVRPFLTHPGMRLIGGLAASVKQPQNLKTVLRRAKNEFTFGTAMLFMLLCAIAPLVFVPLLQEI